MKTSEKDMEGFQIFTFSDILRALREHPDWLDELRRLILTEELLALPQKFEAFLKKEFKPLKATVERVEGDVSVLKQDVSVLKQDVAVLKQDVAVLKQDVAVLKQDVAVLKQDVAVLKQDVAVLKKDVAYLKGEFGRFKGKDFERTIRERYYAYFGRALRKARVIPFEEVLSILDTAEEKGEITETEREGLLKLDILISGQIKALKKDVILAVEVSYTLYEEDIERACERADILARLFQKEVIPAVVSCEVKEELERRAEEKGVLLIKAEY
jgi:cell division protein FtsB